MENFNSDAVLIALAALISLPGLFALYKGMQRDLEEKNLRLQVESYAAEIRRLQIKVDEQQRKIGDLEIKLVTIDKTHQMEMANAKGIIRMLYEALKRVVAQAKQAGVNLAIDMEAMEHLLP